VDDSCSIISCYYDEVFAFWVLAWFFGIFICPFTLQIVLLQWKDFYECT